MVDVGQATTVSGFVKRSVGVALDDVAGWGAMLAAASPMSWTPTSSGAPGEPPNGSSPQTRTSSIASIPELQLIVV